MPLIVNKCCGCIELKTGCFIIGYLALIFDIILIVISILGIIGGGVLASQKDEYNRDIGVFLIIILSLTLTLLVIFLAFTIVLLVGLHKDKPGHVKAYLIYAIIFLVFYIVMFLARLAEKVVAVDILKQIFTILLHIYYLIVIRSQYIVMMESDQSVVCYTV